QSPGVLALAAELDVLGNILADGTAALAGSGEAVNERHLTVELPPGQRLDSFHMVLVAADGNGQGLHLLHIHRSEGMEAKHLQFLSDLLETLVSAGLQRGGSDRNGPDVAGKELVDIEEVGAAGVAEPKLSVKLLADPPGHLNGQGE